MKTDNTITLLVKCENCGEKAGLKIKKEENLIKVTCKHCLRTYYKPL